MFLLMLPLNHYLARLAEPRAIADIVLVFLVVYGVLKLLRGTRAAPMAAGIGAFALLYWLAGNQGLTPFEFILCGALLSLGVTEDSDAVAIVVSEETGLISFVSAGRIKRALDATRLRSAIFQTIEGREYPSRRNNPAHLAEPEETEKIAV